jgi:hypothetical protein
MSDRFTISAIGRINLGYAIRPDGRRISRIPRKRLGPAFRGGMSKPAPPEAFTVVATGGMRGPKLGL